MIEALVGGGIAALGSIFGSRQQSRSANDALKEQRRQFDLTRQDQMPWLQAGQNALGRLQDPAASFQQSPAYGFVRQEGLRGIERSAAARGGAASGNALKALAQFSSGLASQEYGNWWNQQAGLAGAGQSSANALGNFGQSSANAIGQIGMAGGDARASGVAGVANALGQGAANYFDWQQYNRQPRGSIYDLQEYRPYNGRMR